MIRAGYVLLLGSLLSLTVWGTAQASRSEGAATARQGVVRCGGSNFLRLGGTEIQFTSYVLRNFDSVNPIVIERMRIFDANGATLLDTAGGGLPPADNAVLGPANNTLNPNQTALYSSDALIPFLAQNNRPIQFEVEWSAKKPALSLDVITVRHSRQRDPATGAVQADRARHAVECRSIVLR
ncbi:MAG: hypothetical protein ACREF9_17680 [Opitutaceae bacterium]